jgi:5'-3' exoribonuclease 2
LNDKSEAFSTFKEWKTMVENQTEKKVKKLRTDNGMDFCSHEFKNLKALLGTTLFIIHPNRMV